MTHNKTILGPGAWRENNFLPWDPTDDLLLVLGCDSWSRTRRIKYLSTLLDFSYCQSCASVIRFVDMNLRCDIFYFRVRFSMPTADK